MPLFSVQTITHLLVAIKSQDCLSVSSSAVNLDQLLGQGLCQENLFFFFFFTRTSTCIKNKTLGGSLF